MPATLLIADDDPIHRQLLRVLLQREHGYMVEEAENGKSALACLMENSAGHYAALLLDLHMPEMDGMQVLETVHARFPHLPVIMITGDEDVEHAVRAVKLGAVDFLSKPIVPAKLEVALTNAVRLHALSDEVARLKRGQEGQLHFEDILGHDAGLGEAVSQARKMALTDLPVLITGETGAGKELFARALHGEGRRAGQPFIAVNCGALPENLAESILFGHEKGAFTGATSAAMGKFREAEGGTLFLDEVGELPLGLQVKLLRAIQYQEIETVGSGQAQRVNVRILAATHRHLAEDVMQGRFRQDLFYRLNVLALLVPPLRERGQDILRLSRYFLERLAAEQLIPPKQLQPDAADYLLQHDWPGNVRELEHLMQRITILSDAALIDRATLQALEHDRLPEADHLPDSHRGPLILPLQDENGIVKPLAMLEQEIMQRILDHSGQNVTRAAELLGMAKSTFYRKRKESLQ